MIAMETGKAHFCSYHNNNFLDKKMIYPIYESDIYILTMKKCVDWISSKQEKILHPQKCPCWENGSRS